MSHYHPKIKRPGSPKRLPGQCFHSIILLQQSHTESKSNYTMMTNRNHLFLPLNLEILIDENNPVWKLTEICDTLDYSGLYEEYLQHWRSVNPAILFEILVFAYMNRIYSSRDIESACKTDIRFMWLLQGQSEPDHSTLARFQNKRLVDAIENLFYQLIQKLDKLREIEIQNIFVDGTKIEANANRYTFV